MMIVKKKTPAKRRVRTTYVRWGPTYRSGFRLSGASRRDLPSTRKFWNLTSRNVTTALAVKTGDSPYGLGGTYGNISMEWALKDFISVTSGVPIAWDMYRIKYIEVFASCLKLEQEPGTSFGPIVIYSSVDTDDVNPTTWTAMSQRSNVNQTTLRAGNPMIKIAAFRPTPNFVSQVGDHPSNIIPSKQAWFDLAVTSQNFNGLKCHVSTHVSQIVTFTARATVEFKGNI